MSRVERNHGTKKRKKNAPNSTEEEILGKKGKKRKKKKKKRRGLKIFLGVILAIFLIVGGALLYGALTTGLVQDPTGLVKIQDQFNNGKVNILMLGSDIRPDDDKSRTDTIIVGSFDFKAGTANLLSIPRDTRVPIPGYGEDKINHSYAYGGLDLTEKTVEEFLGISIDKTVEINFETFKAAVEEIGGVEIDVEEDMYYPEEGIDLKAGKQILNGDDALAYVRFRGTPTADLGRVERQQKFIQALGSSIKTKANVLQQADILNKLLGDMKTNVNLQEAIYMFSKYKDASNFKLSTWTSEGTPKYIDGVSYLIPSYDSAERSLDFLQGRLFVVTDPEDPEKKILVTAEEKAQLEKTGSLDSTNSTTNSTTDTTTNKSNSTNSNSNSNSDSNYNSNSNYNTY